jgi:pyridoxamine 5'-phosphate oxidase family protein
METSAKYRNVAVNPDVSFVVDDSIGEGATNMRFVELRRRAQQAIQAPPPEDTEGLSRGIIRIHPRRLISWGVGSKGALVAELQEASTSATPTSRTGTSPGTSCGAARSPRRARR